MSTRSGKRIHTSLNEDVDVHVQELKSERKTRSKRQKESNLPVPEKKRKHYVRYPSEEEIASEINSNGEDTRKSRRQTLKEQNAIITDSETSNDDRKSMRTTRRTKKFEVTGLDTVETHHDKENEEEKKSKKKKQKVKSSLTEENIFNEHIVEVSKKSKKKKNKRKSNSIIVEDIHNKNMNKSNVSNDSFHSAAGSPIKNLTEKVSIDNDVTPPHCNKIKKKKRDASDNGDDKTKSAEQHSNKKKKTLVKVANELPNGLLSNSISVEPAEQCKESITEATTQVEDIINNKFEKDTSMPVLNKSLEHSSKKRNTDIKNSSYTIKEANNTFEIDKSTRDSNIKPLNNTYDKSPNKKSKNSTCLFNSSSTNLNSTINREESYQIVDQITTESVNNITYSGSKKRKSSIQNSTYDKIDTLEATINQETDNGKSLTDASISKETRQPDHSQVINLNDTYDKNSKNETPNSLNITFDRTTKLDTTFNKNLKNDSMVRSQMKPNARSSIISSDATDNSSSDLTDDNHVSITSDDSKTDNIINTTPVLIESSMDESNITENVKVTRIQKQNTTEPVNIPLRREGTFTESDKTNTKENNVPPLQREGTFTQTDTPQKKKSMLPDIDLPIVLPQTIPTTPNNIAKTSSNKAETPLKREGTFTKESPIGSPIRPERSSRRKSLPSPGCTPFPVSKSSTEEKSVMNVTRSIEKPRRSFISLADVPPRMTRVMFCSPVNNPATVTQMRGKIIKSNLKGSIKSFVFDESISESCRPARKRSHTQAEAEDARGARRVDSFSRPRTASASARLQEDTPPGKPSPKKPQRTKLPNFAALHQKQFQRMESLDECQERKAKRAKRLLTPTAASGRLSPKETQEAAQPEPAKKVETPKSKQPDTKLSYTRFGYKLNLDVNPFSIPPKNTAAIPKEIPQQLKRQATLPSLAGATTLRKEIAKQTILREKSFTEKRQVNRNENRTVIKGVRTNRRFELQMKMRNITDK